MPTLTEKQKKFAYAEEADVLNVALFGMTAKEWRENNPKLAEDGNMRDYTDLLHLVILNNLENSNAEFIKLGISQGERLVKLNESARNQMEILKNNNGIKELEILQKQINASKHLIEKKIILKRLSHIINATAFYFLLNNPCFFSIVLVKT